MAQLIVAIRHFFANAPNHDDYDADDDSYVIIVIIIIITLSSIVLLIIS